VILVGIELGGLMYTGDGGQTWTDHRPDAERDAHAIAWHPRAPGRAYEAAGGGPAWSLDGGWTWHSVDDGLDRHYTWALAVDPDDPNLWYISASPGPWYAHSEGNAQAHICRWRGKGPWQALGGGLPQPLNSMPYALASLSGRLYAGLSDGTIYVSYDAGEGWKRLTLSGDPLTSILSMACVE